MTRRSDIPDELGDVFSVRNARAAGVSPGRLRAADLVGTLHGARRRGEDAPAGDRYARRRSDLILRCREYASVARGPFAFSHSTAARLYGIAVPERVEERIEIHVAVESGQPRRAGVITHRFSSLEVRLLEGLPVVGPELAWLHLAAALSFDELIVAGDCLVRRKAPLSTLDRMARMLELSEGQRGVVRARSAFGEVRAGTDSPPESRVRVALVRAGLPEPVIGYTVHHEGYWVGTPDLAYPREPVAIEYQGAVHRDQATFEEDVARLERFREAGWTVVQITRTDLAHPPAFISRVRRALAAAGTRV